MLQSGLRLQQATDRARGEASTPCRKQLRSLLPTAALYRSPVPSSSNSGRYLRLNVITLALMYSNLLPDCVHDCPTFLCVWMCVFSFGISFETIFLFLNTHPKAVRQMVLELAVLSLSCAFLKRFVCPMHPTMPWRYQHFVI